MQPHHTRLLSIVAFISIVVALTACDGLFGDLSELDPPDDATLDAGPDVDDDADCVPESNEEFCERQEVICEKDVVANDICGQARSEDCDRCADEMECDFESEQCVPDGDCEPESDEQFCERLGVQCAKDFEGEDSCEEPRVTDCDLCPEEEFCDSEASVCIPIDNDCDGDCAAQGLICIAGECVECFPGDECEDGRLCSPTGECVDADNLCQTDDDCDSGVCNDDTGQCEDGECTSDADCSGNEECDEELSICVTSCTTHDNCFPDEVCFEGGCTHVECDDHDDCPDGSLCGAPEGDGDSMFCAACKYFGGPVENCDGDCVDVTSSKDHCGECGNSCEDDEFCNSGTCDSGE